MHKDQDQAELIGYDDGLHGRDMPTIYAGDLALEAAWERGNSHGVEAAIILACPYCGDRSMDMCPVHG